MPSFGIIQALIRLLINLHFWCYMDMSHDFGISSESAIQVSGLDEWLNERQVLNDLVRQHLLRAKDHMKKQVDAKRSECSFLVLEWVFLKVQPYVQSSLASRANQKLSFKFFRPYKIIARVGAVAYKLQLLESSLVHLVFHVSQLKKALGDHHQVTAALPDHTFPWSIPERVLQNRSVLRGGHSVTQVLIKWSDVPESLAT